MRLTKVALNIGARYGSFKTEGTVPEGARSYEIGPGMDTIIFSENPDLKHEIPDGCSSYTAIWSRKCAESPDSVSIEFYK